MPDREEVAAAPSLQIERDRWRAEAMRRAVQAGQAATELAEHHDRARAQQDRQATLEAELAEARWQAELLRQDRDHQRELYEAERLNREQDLLEKERLRLALEAGSPVVRAGRKAVRTVRASLKRSGGDQVSG